MADPPTCRPMDDFLINPTTAMSNSVHQTDMDVDDYLTSIADSHDALILKFARTGSSKPARTFIDFSEPQYWPTYTSDEEVASPVDNDDVADRPESTLSLSTLSSLPETLAVNCDKVQRQCNKAQAVVLKPVGKARMVAVPKPVDISHYPRVVRPTPNLTQARSIPNLNRSYVNAGEYSYQSQRSTQSSPSPFRGSPSVAPGSQYQFGPESHAYRRRKSLARLPSVPLIQAATQALPRVQANRAMASSSHLPPDEIPSPRPARLVKPNPATGAISSPQAKATPKLSPPASPPSTIARRITKFSSSINLNRFGKNSSRNSSDSSSSSESDHFKDAEPVALPPPIPFRPVSASTARPKMVARGASERAPPIVLPPFPTDTGDDDPRQGRWPIRKSSAPRLRMAAMQGSFVSAQA